MTTVAATPNIKINFIVDNREDEILSLIKCKKDVIFETANLDIGDFIFTLNDQPEIIIERKTIQDLAQSIKDGRYKEQKMRLLSNFGGKNKCIIYLIEGFYELDPLERITPAPDVLFSSCVNMMARDKLAVYHTNNSDQTTDFLVKMYHNIIKNDFWLEEQKKMQVPGLFQAAYAGSLNVKKKDNVDPDVCFSAQLCVIPGISSDKVAAIQTKYKNMKQMIDGMTANGPDDLKGCGKKIGEKISWRIYNYLFGLPVDTTHKKKKIRAPRKKKEKVVVVESESSSSSSSSDNEES